MATLLNKLDKQILKVIKDNTITENVITVSNHIEQENSFEVLCNHDFVISKIKQSILKAIMEKVNKEFFCTHCNNSGKVWDGFLGNWVPCETENDCLFTVVCKFESVIKEVLK